MSTEAGQSRLAKATFAGGCFWCMQPPYEGMKGVSKVTVGYTGGKKPNPTYEETCSGKTGHAEAVEIIFDPHQLSYQQLLDVFWKNIDPTTKNAQFADKGSQYRTAIFYHDPEQQRFAEASKDVLQKSGKFKSPIVTEIVPASTFYPAEDYHQQYYKKCPLRYQGYRAGSGRQSYLERLWGKSQDH